LLFASFLWEEEASSYQVGEIKGQNKSWALLKPPSDFLSSITMLISAWILPTGKSQAPLQLWEQKGKKDYDLKTRRGSKCSLKVYLQELLVKPERPRQAGVLVYCTVLGSVVRCV